MNGEILNEDKRLHDEQREGYRDMICADTAAEIEKRHAPRAPNAPSAY
ncbi:MAG TPA: hypothetical protein GX700_06990 [Paracoccus sp.]|nr:hypothetical protein [Paracoccus sp. (in: a-proteobacteria)]